LQTILSQTTRGAGDRASMTFSKGPNSTTTSHRLGVRSSIDLDKENIARKSLVPTKQIKVGSPIQGQMLEDRKRSRNALVSAKTTTSAAQHKPLDASKLASSLADKPRIEVKQKTILFHAKSTKNKGVLV
jgi:hypothetical protein